MADKIPDGFISDDTMNGLLFLTEHDRTPTCLELDRFIKALGYHLPPKEEDLALLSTVELMTICFHPSLDERGTLTTATDIAKAQRHRISEWLKGVK